MKSDPTSMPRVIPSMAVVMAAWTFSGIIPLIRRCVARARPLNGPGGRRTSSRQARISGERGMGLR